jgi:dTDP-4-amino-4,6-dideoxy-D-galactose acyltransferase
MIINKKKWDSDFFKMKIGEMYLENSKDYNQKELSLLSKEYNLIYIFSNEDIKGLKPIDKREIFKLNIIDRETIKQFNDSISFSSEKHSYDEIHSLTLQSGVYSRFKIDRNFKNNEYKKLYNEWIKKSISKEISIDIIIILIENKIVGFATLNKKSAQLADIGLVAVDEKYRGRGIAKELIHRTIFKAKKLGFKEIQVITQNENKPARKLYEAIGFNSIKTTNIYHYWNYDTIQ